ncbi:MAG: hypothetical protein KAQ97_08525 [Candidatus Fermentibacteraceae bacterium]|nr:hypothetical protein [Candidatus Fermentibacteraceae bacterium]
MKTLKLALIFCLVLPTIAGSNNLFPTIGAKITTPQKISISLGISGTSWGRLFGPDSGFLIRLEPGLSGGKFHIGTRHTFNMALIPVCSMDICASVMYTWNNPWIGLKNDQTYIGGELQFGAHLLIVSAGLYRHVAGGDEDHDWVFSAGAGLGF